MESPHVVSSTSVNNSECSGSDNVESLAKESDPGGGNSKANVDSELQHELSDDAREVGENVSSKPKINYCVGVAKSSNSEQDTENALVESVNEKKTLDKYVSEFVEEHIEGPKRVLEDMEQTEEDTVLEEKPASTPSLLIPSDIDMKQIDFDEIEKQAMQEILHETQRMAERATVMGASAWVKPKVPAVNKTFLRNTLVSTLRNPIRGRGGGKCRGRGLKPPQDDVFNIEDVDPEFDAYRYAQDDSGKFEFENINIVNNTAEAATKETWDAETNNCEEGIDLNAPSDTEEFLDADQTGNQGALSDPLYDSLSPDTDHNDKQDEQQAVSKSKPIKTKPSHAKLRDQENRRSNSKSDEGKTSKSCDRIKPGRHNEDSKKESFSKEKVSEKTAQPSKLEKDCEISVSDADKLSAKDKGRDNDTCSSTSKRKHSESDSPRNKSKPRSTFRDKSDDNQKVSSKGNDLNSDDVKSEYRETEKTKDEAMDLHNEKETQNNDGDAIRDSAAKKMGNNDNVLDKTESTKLSCDSPKPKKKKVPTATLR